MLSSPEKRILAYSGTSVSLLKRNKSGEQEKNALLV